MEKLRDVAFRVPEATYRKLKAQATKNSRSVAGEVRHLISTTLEGKKK